MAFANRLRGGPSLKRYQATRRRRELLGDAHVLAGVLLMMKDKNIDAMAATTTYTTSKEERNAENVETARSLIGNAAGASSTLGLAYLGVKALQRRVDFAKVRQMTHETFASRPYIDDCAFFESI